MAISQQQAQIFFDWITSQGVDSLRCDICQNNSFHLDIVATIPQQANGDVVSIGEYDLQHTVPLVLCYCDRCGSTKIFNAMMIGVLSPGEGGTASRYTK